MKTLEELAKIRELALQKSQGLSEVNAGEKAKYTFTIGMATCGITAGARPVFTTLLECITDNGTEHIKILQTGCFGKCKAEPMMTLEDAAGKIYYYGNLDPEKAKVIFANHILKDQPVEEYFVEMES